MTAPAGWDSGLRQPVTHQSGQTVPTRTHKTELQYVAMQKLSMENSLLESTNMATTADVRDDRINRARGEIVRGGVLRHLSSKTYPNLASKSDKAVIRKRAHKFHLVDGVLFYMESLGNFSQVARGYRSPYSYSLSRDTQISNGMPNSLK